MKTLISFIFCVLAANSFAQETTMTVKQAEEYLNAGNPSVKVDITDANDDYPLLEKAKVGEIIVVQDKIYKILEFRSMPQYSVGYILLNGRQKSLAEINAITDEVLKKYREGESFIDLSMKYNMNGNPNPYDNTLLKSSIDPVFEEAIKAHKIGEIFTVDMGTKNIYMIAVKNLDDRIVKTVYVRYAIM